MMTMLYADDYELTGKTIVVPDEEVERRLKSKQWKKGFSKLYDPEDAYYRDKEIKKNQRLLAKKQKELDELA